MAPGGPHPQALDCDEQRDEQALHLGVRGGEVGGGLHRLRQPGLQLGQAALAEEERRTVRTRRGGHDLAGAAPTGEGSATKPAAVNRWLSPPS